MQYFVKNGTFLNKIKHTRLRKLVMLGASHSASLNKKTWLQIRGVSDDNLYVTAFDVFNPSLPRDLVSETIYLNDLTKLKLEDFHAIFEPVAMYDLWRADEDEKERIRSVVASFENAAKTHGQRQCSVANGFIADVEPYLYESGKALKKAREALYKELGV